MCRRWMFAVLFLIFMLATTTCALATGSTLVDWFTGSGCIYNAKTLPDGSHVDLVLEDIVKIKENYVVLREPFRAQDRLVVLTTPHPDLRLGQVVDCSGTLVTLPTGERALANVTIMGYASSETGGLVYHPGIIKAFPDYAQQSWPSKIDLTIRESVAGASSQSSYTEEIPNSEPAEGPKFYPRISRTTAVASARTQGVRVQSYYDNIPGLKQANPDPGEPVELQCKQILAVGTEVIGGSTYKYLDIAEDSSSQDWVRCYYDDANPTTSNRVNKITGQVQYTDGGNTLVICVDDGPDYEPQTLVGQVRLVSPNTVAYALSQSDGSAASLTGKVVTANNDTDFPGSLYVQEPVGSNGFGGIRIDYSTNTFSRGSIVSITGAVALGSDGERKIVATSVTSGESGIIPGALGMPNKILGGGGFNVNSPGVNYPAGSGIGLYNKGLLVKSWGKVTAVDTVNKYFYIDDGTGFQDGTVDGNNQPIKGVRVSWAWATAGKSTIIPPLPGSYVSVAGISGSESSSNNLIRVIRPRDYLDMFAFNPQDVTNPAVSIISPYGTIWHKAPGATNIVVSGTATDSQTGIASVKVKIDSGNWEAASYNSSTHSWSFNWQSPQSGRVTVSATDFAGNSSEIYEDVVVTEITSSVIYVSKNGNNNSAGTSWGKAKLTVSGTNGAMASALSGNEIWVAEGTYVGEHFALTSGVALYGGFSGQETVREQRDWRANETILDRTDGITWYYSVVSISGTSSATTIDGFTIQNGNGLSGGGIYCNGSARIANNVIRRNNGVNNGGGLYISGSGPVAVVGNVIIDNVRGGITCSSTGLQIVNNTIFRNNGTGVEVTNGGSPVLSNNIIAYNSTGIYKYSGTTPTFTNNIVYKNSVSNYNWTPVPSGDIVLTSGTDLGIPNIECGDWHITGTSPCRDQGVLLSILGDNDIDGGSREYGSAVDIGADEWNGIDPGAPATFYVCPGGQGDKTGKNWDNAADKVQTAADAAYAAGGGEVWVAGGLYSGANGKAALKPFVHLYGGFSIGDASRSARDWKTNQTILDGGGSGSVVSMSGASCRIDGFIIQNGYNTNGGGVYSSSSATILNNIIRSNRASSNGGGIYGTAQAVAGNVIIGNIASNGGGFYCDGNGQTFNNTFLMNVATTSGGGIYINAASAVFSNNIVASNAGGGIYKSSSSSPTFTKNIVYQNSGSNYSWNPVPSGDIVLTSGTDLGIPNIDWGDWHISEDSPCRDQGVSISGLLDKDIDGESRSYLNTDLDIGADEWSGADPENLNIFYVSPGGSGEKSGASWSDAADNLQTAIDAAYSAGGGEVWVAGGTYIGDSAKANLKSSVHIYGGFAVNDTSKSARNWKTNQTILDGNASGSVVTVSNAIGCAIDGFIIKNGGATNGSGINCSSAVATIANSVIYNNNAGNYGGGLYGANSLLAVAGNVFMGNKAGCGGGIYLTNSSGQIANNTIIVNTATINDNGGGIYLASGNPFLANNIISSNAGGGIHKSSGSPSFTKNDVYGNSDYAYSWKTWAQNDTEIGSDLNPATSDPCITYIDYGDWHIAQGSPCINQGASISGIPVKDIDSESRPYQSTAVDIGADEWSGTDPSPLNSSIFYVCQGGNGSKDGTSWNNAADNLQTAITAAYNAGGGEVWVAGGTYIGALGKTELKSTVKIYGGFAVDDTSRSNRNWKTHPTILDGGGSGSVITVSNAARCEIDGFVIRNGNATNGGGINCSHAVAKISNNVLRENKSTNGGSLYGSYSLLTVAGNVALDNSATSGSGFYYTNVSGQTANNTIISNIATSNGGGIYLLSSTIALSNNVVAFNSNGGIYTSGTTPTLANNIVYQNSGFDYNWIPSGDIVLASGIDLGIPNIDWGDWHISEDSPCRDQGVSIPSLLDKDLDCESRTYQNTAVDIGADEWNGTDPVLSIIRVKSDGNDNNDGSTWALAKQHIQNATKQVELTGGEVWVKGGAGTYNETISLPAHVRLYGGFAGTAQDEFDKSARDWKNNVTVLDADGLNGSAVTVNGGKGNRIDGFTIRNGSAANGGGIYCNNTSISIANNVIENNSATSSGGGICCYGTISGMAPTIMNNLIKSNSAADKGGAVYFASTTGRIANNGLILNSAKYGAGVYCSSSNVELSNNTITCNTLVSGGACGGIYLNYSGAKVYNTIVASNDGSGIKTYSSSSAVLQYNDVWGQTPLYDGISDQTGLNGNISLDPLLNPVDHLHIIADSNGLDCKDKGLNNVVLQETDLDIDDQPRIADGVVDIGVDEIDGCVCYLLELTAEKQLADINDLVKVTANVYDQATHSVVENCRVDFSLNSGTLQSIPPDELPYSQIDVPPTTGFGTTDAQGNVAAYVTRNAEGMINVTATVQTCSAAVSKTTRIVFGDVNAAPVDLVFLIDVTGSTSSGTKMMNGINATLDYLEAQLQSQGRDFTVAGIKFSDSYSPDALLNNNRAVLYNFTTDIAAFKNWVNQAGPGGGIEYQLDILMFAKDMVPNAIPGLWIALATDENSDSILDKTAVANALVASNSIVFIDPGGQNDPDNQENLITYYQPLAVNGGHVEQESGNLGTFTFQHMRQAILGAP